ncbi:GDPD-domain-containing protein [Aspergillus campestris IBT 28561]|uniref:GDPD-domain-containing protein n=1 Tax=Aspergillus campestris (strain IBT 28561) TaxID=1392248 RepID=A0A2I1D6D9_ASPC2|nr:GDPD-domain-containing protein [Aspergillus campestris IBT 28561]PKY05440.1 GDPD-domain-containing protein [Aspergillus campestris IBT 28561]
MKFTHNYHRHQVPEWTASYVPYAALSRQLKRIVCEAELMGREPVFDEVYASLAGSVESFDECCEGRYQYLCARRMEILKAYGYGEEEHGMLRIGNANCAELGNLLSAMVELRGDLDKLQWYYRVNAEAIELVYAKIERHCVPPMVETHQSRKSNWMDINAHWAARATRYEDIFNMLTVPIARTYADVKLHSGEGSPGLDCVGLGTELDDYRIFLVYFVREDNKSWELASMLEKMSMDDAIMGLHFRALIYDLALLAIVSGARDSVAFLLEKAFARYGAAVDHNVLNQIITVVGRRGMLNGQSSLELLTCSQCDDTEGKDGMGETLFLRAVERLGPDGEDVLLSMDIFVRRPLHYGAMYGLQTVCQRILSYFEDWEVLRLAGQILTLDSQGQTPLHYAVINGHAGVTRIFLDILNDVEDSEPHNKTAILNEVFSIAVKYQHDEIVYMLAKCRAVSHPCPHAETETALYIAAQSGRAEYVEALLNHNKHISLNLNTPEPVHGWTPLFVACVEGHHAVVRLLLRAGAKQDIRDQLGWTAKEHAALRGHLEIADMVDAGNTDDLDISDGPASVLPKTTPTEKAIFRKNRSYVIVNLGALQYGQRGEALELRDFSHSPPMPKSVYAPNGFLMEISIGDGRETNSHCVKLPLLRDMLNEPFVFPVVDPTEAVISFKLFRAGRRLVGSGAALLKSLNDGLGEGRESLVRTRTIAILEREKLGVMGTVTFTFVVAGPVDCAVPGALQSRDVGGGGVQLVGHRGLGQNTASRTYLQMGENTIESFLSAAKQGAAFVEIDVQLTRDLVPIIYHDFSLSESGTDIAIHDLSFDQFAYASKLQSTINQSICMPTKPRSRSLTRAHERELEGTRQRMMHTVDFISKGFKPNTRGDFIQDSFATLEELLVQLPQSISFNVEIKYPRLHEAAEAGVVPASIEINTFIDKILSRIFHPHHPQPNRSIILSSFTPEVCILLAIKQQVYPVMFITNAGKPPMTDKEMRAGSMKAAVRFAKRWNLAGIVFASELLVLCPRLVQYVKGRGLVCGSYGAQNNCPEYAKMQAAAGVDLIMTDRVGLISAALD